MKEIAVEVSSAAMYQFAVREFLAPGARSEKNAASFLFDPLRFKREGARPSTTFSEQIIEPFLIVGGFCLVFG
jgi:hypothetical protein